MGNLEVFDTNNPPELCQNCPDLADEFFSMFTVEWLFRLACASCGLQLIKNKNILSVIQNVIEEHKAKKNKQ